MNGWAKFGIWFLGLFLWAFLGGLTVGLFGDQIGLFLKIVFFAGYIFTAYWLTKSPKNEKRQQGGSIQKIRGKIGNKQVEFEMVSNKKKGSVGWLIFWFFAGSPIAALIYALMRRWD